MVSGYGNGSARLRVETYQRAGTPYRFINAAISRCLLIILHRSRDGATFERSTIQIITSSIIYLSC
jgi:hypothetical protein